MEDKFSSGNAITPERRSRINRIKKVIVIINFTVLFTLVLCCSILLIRVISLNREVKSLQVSLDKMRNMESENNEESENGENTGEEIETADVSEDIPASQETVSEKVAYLTFDDGPSENTDRILDILDRYNVKATFFVNGKEYTDYTGQYKEITARGNSIGMHSYSHDFSQVYESVESFQNDTTKIHDFLYQLTGVDIKIYRFPGGSSTTKTTNISQYIDYLNSKGYTYYDWNVSSGDAVESQLEAGKIVENVMNGVKGLDRVIVLMHDSSLKDTTVEALPIIIENLLEEGYEILPIVNTTPPVHHVMTNS